MPWKLDGLSNKLREVENDDGSPSDHLFATELEALEFMFDRSIKNIDRTSNESERAFLSHKRISKKFGTRLRELRAVPVAEKSA